METAPPKPSFQDRVNAIFGSLGNAPGGWNLSDQQTVLPGRDADLDSSDEDDEELPERAQNHGPGGSARLVTVEDHKAGEDEEEEEDEEEAQGAQEQDLQASRAFCRAFDREAEEDEFDMMAAGSYHTEGRGDTRPSRNLEVLDDNPFDRLCDLRRGSASPSRATPSTSGMDTNAGSAGAAGHAAPVEQAPGEPRPQRGAAVAGREAAGGARGPREGARVKPGHGVWAPPHRREDGGRHELGQQHSAQQEPQPSGGQRQQQQQQQQQQEQQPLGRPQQQRPKGRGWGGRGGRHMPDHVKHPHKWTCYTLDEPLFVGQGDAAALAGGEDGGLRQAVASAQAAAAAAATGAGQTPGEGPPVERYLTNFGVGIEFRPKGGRPKDSSSAAKIGGQDASGARTAAPIAAAWDEGEAAFEGQAASGSTAVAMDVEEGVAADAAPAGQGAAAGAGGQANKKRARQFRNRQQDTM